MVLWHYPQDEHSLWLRTGCGSGSYEDYHRDLTERARRAQDEGRRLIVVETSVANVLELMTRHGLPHTREGCEEALRRTYVSTKP